MRVVEIFGSIDGEGLRTGELATFVRLSGCNLRCSYCDTTYSFRVCDSQEMSRADILKRVKDIGYKNVTLTGGEPLLRREAFTLVKELVEQGHQVNVETNGSINIKPLLDFENVIITMDYKTPSSGVEFAMRLENLEALREQDVLKFVVSEEDLPRVREVLKTYDINAWVYLSPVFGKIEPARLVDFQKSLYDEGVSTDKVRVQIQLHKILWSPERRGV